MIGTWQLILVIIIALLLFGAGKVPQIMSDIGKGIKSLRNELNEEKNEIKKNNKENIN